MKASSFALLALLVFIPSLAGHSQTVEFDGLKEPKLGEKQRLLLELERLESAKDADFEEALEVMTSKVAAYAETKKKECLGEYSSIEITAEGETKKLKNKLSKEEKKLCLLELVRLRKRLANSLFSIRKKLLVEQHQEQLEHLEELRRESLNELEVMGGKLK